ncbi:MAG: hypothetical protein M3R02_11870 [Chloroflexota bacterium]|nr:hypothetical protein [Chloroflexota bacterium]
MTDDLTVAEALAATGTFATPLLVVGQTQVLGSRPERLRSAQGADQPEEAVVASSLWWRCWER